MSDQQESGTPRRIEPGSTVSGRRVVLWLLGSLVLVTLAVGLYLSRAGWHFRGVGGKSAAATQPAPR